MMRSPGLFYLLCTVKFENYLVEKTKHALLINITVVLISGAEHREFLLLQNRDAE